MVKYSELMKQLKESVEINEIYKKAEEQAKYKFMVRCITKMINEGEYDNDPTIKNLRSKLNQKHRFYFITINPKDDITLKDFMEKVHKYTGRSMFDKGTVSYTFEQRSNDVDDAGKGMHVHIAAQSDLKKSHILRNTISSFKHMIGTEQHIDVRIYPIKYLDDKIKYMKGDKWDEDKSESVEVNKFWRIANNIESLYNC